MQRIGIVGAGHIARSHIGNYKLLENAKIEAVCDVRPDAAAQMASLADSACYSSVEEMLSNCDIDAVDVCTPTFTHLDIVTTAAKAGKHICVEKPMAGSVRDAQACASIAEKSGVRLFVGHVLRWFPQYLKAREVAHSGAIGRPVVVRSSRCVAHPVGWFTDYSLSGGVIMDLIIHDFDWMRWCFGEVERVFAQGLVNRGLENLDYALVTLRFKSGLIGHVEGSWARPGATSINLEIAGTEGLFNFNNTESGTVVSAYKDDHGTLKTSSESPGEFFPMLGEIRNFVDCLENGNEFVITPTDGIEAVRIAESALESIRTGKPVKLQGGQNE